MRHLGGLGICRSADPPVANRSIERSRRIGIEVYRFRVVWMRSRRRLSMTTSAWTFARAGEGGKAPWTGMRAALMGT